MCPEKQYTTIIYPQELRLISNIFYFISEHPHIFIFIRDFDNFQDKLSENSRQVNQQYDVLILLTIWTYIVQYSKQIQMKSENCTDHDQIIELMCLDEDCKEKFLLCKQCNSNNLHKHSKTSIMDVEKVKDQLKEVWEIQNNPITEYRKKFKDFYQKLKQQVNDSLSNDENLMYSLLEKISYHHLPKGANSAAYISFKKRQYHALDKPNMINLINEAQNGQIQKQPQYKQFLKSLDLELSKIKQKVITFKFVLPATKFKTQLLIPRFSENSSICPIQELAKLYGIFNSKGLLIRSGNLVYRGSQFQFQHKSFYNRCNDMKNCVALCQLENGRIVGGFTNIPFVYHEQEKLEEEEFLYGNSVSKKSFIFSISNVGSFDVQNENEAIIYRKQQIGPIFGKDLDLGSRQVTSVLGNSFRSPKEYNALQAKALLLGGEKQKLKELEIWQLSF